MKTLSLTLLLVVASSVAGAAQTPSKTYAETRKLLSKMERAHEYAALRKLFEESEARKSDLIHALSDPEQKVSLNAQTVIKYVADPEALSALEKWFEYRRYQPKEYWMSPVVIVTGVQYLHGTNRDLVKLILKDLWPDWNDGWGKTIAYERKSKTRLVEIVFGEIFTEGWHVVLRQENRRWRLMSKSLVWQS
jgi:hypothetical protein